MSFQYGDKVRIKDGTVSVLSAGTAQWKLDLSGLTGVVLFQPYRPPSLPSIYEVKVTHPPTGIVVIEMLLEEWLTEVG